MKIAIIARNRNILPSPKNAGWAPGIVMANEARVLSSLGVDVRVYCAKNSRVAGRVVHFDLLSGGEAYSGIVPAQKKIREEYYNNIYQFRIIEHIRKNPVDLIHLHDYRDFPLYDNAGLNIPIAVTLHGDYYYNFEKTPVLLKKELAKINFIAVGSEKRPKGIGKPFVSIPNIIDFKKFNFISKPKERFVYVGRLNRSKGPDTAIRAAKLANVNIDIYGGTYDNKEWEDKIKAQINTYPKAVFHGFLEHDKIRIAFNAKALIFPMREPEGFPSVILESLASGTPVITYGLGGSAQMIKNGVSGYLVKPGDIRSLVSAIKKINNIDREKCRAYALDKFNEKKIGCQLIKTFEDIIKNKNS